MAGVERNNSRLHGNTMVLAILSLLLDNCLATC